MVAVVIMSKFKIKASGNMPLVLNIYAIILDRGQMFAWHQSQLHCIPHVMYVAPFDYRKIIPVMNSNYFPNNSVVFVLKDLHFLVLVSLVTSCHYDRQNVSFTYHKITHRCFINIPKGSSPED